MAKPILSVNHLEFSYPHQTKSVLNGLSFEVMPNQLICVLGSNGAGKTTLFKLLLGLLKPTHGQIFYNQHLITDLSTRSLAKQVSYIPQIDQIQFHYSVMDMVLMGTTASFGYFSGPTQAAKEQALKALERLDLSAYKNRAYDQLSGGEQQLVLIARALAQNAPMLIMDEPCSSLDYGNQMKVMAAIKHLTTEGYTVLLSTHQPEHARLFSNQILVLHKGQIQAYGEPSQVLNIDLLKTIYHIQMKIDHLTSTGETICLVDTDALYQVREKSQLESSD